MKLLYPFARRFIAGDNFISAKPIIDDLLSKKFEVILNFIGEENDSKREAINVQKEYLELLRQYQNHQVSLSMKLSQFGILDSESQCIDLIEPIISNAYQSKQTIRFDSEDSSSTDKILNVCYLLNKKYPNTLGYTLQSNLFRSKDDVLGLIKSNISIRLVKGAYKENNSNAYKKKNMVRDNFLYLADIINNHHHFNSAIATHDELLINELKTSNFKYEFLFGVRRDIQTSLISKNYKVGIYLPYGNNWFPYTIRRLKEWKNISFIGRNIIREWINAV
jgi:proline dehydrogenase